MQITAVSVTCPVCKSDIPLSETLAQPLLIAEREKIQSETRQLSLTLQSKEAELARGNEQLALQRQELKKKESDLDGLVASRLDGERKKLTEQANENAAQTFSFQLASAEQELARTRARVSQLESAELQLRKQRTDLEEEKRNLELNVERRLDGERELLRQKGASEERAKWSAEVALRDEQLATYSDKLREAEKLERKARQERQILDQEKRRLELEVERKLDAERTKIREATQKLEEERHCLKLAEKEKVIEDMRRQIEELRRKSEQGSQQIQGEVLEDAIETLLSEAFPNDRIEPISKGKPGADLIQNVVAQGGQCCGVVLWESKNTKKWSQEWLGKNREDQRILNAHVGVIVSTALPRDLETFGYVDGVWIASRKCALPLAYVLRQMLLETARAQASAKCSETKKELLYGYLTSIGFRQRVAGVVDAYLNMQRDLESERLTISRLWAKRQKQLEVMIAQTAGFYGDIQGIAGKSIPEIEGLDVSLAISTGDQGLSGDRGLMVST
jgi:hypothetical protein